MSKTKFATLTAGLLARKGEAQPSAHSAFALASALARAATLPEQPPHKTQGPVDLAALIERAPRPSVPPPEPLPAAAEETIEPPPPPAFLFTRSVALQPPSFGMRGRTSRAPVATRPQRGQIWPDFSRVHRVAVTVRLEDPSYLRLKLAGVKLHRTNQDLVARAIDAYLTALGVGPVSEEQLRRWQAGNGDSL